MIETSVQHWEGVDSPMDAVILFDVLMYVERADRLALYQKLLTQCLAPNGIIIVVIECNSPNSGWPSILERLGKPLAGYYEDVEREMLAVGFNLWGPDDFSNYSENEVKFLQILADNVASEQHIRAIIDDILHKRSQQGTYHKKFAIFKK